MSLLPGNMGTTYSKTSRISNLTITGNTVASTNTNGDININPNGTGQVKSTHIPDTGTSLVTVDYCNTTSATLTNKSLSDTTTSIINATDNTKAIKFDVASVTTGTSRTLSVPNANTTIAGTDVAQTLTNKIIDSTTNTVTADKLRSSTGTITISSASAPIANMVLKATSSTSAAWANAGMISYNTITLTTSTSVTSASYTVINGMSVGTLPLGTYLILFTCSYNANNTSGVINLGVSNDNTLAPVAGTAMGHVAGVTSTQILSVHYVISSTGTNPIQLLYNSGASNRTITMTTRTMTYIALT